MWALTVPAALVEVEAVVAAAVEVAAAAEEAAEGVVGVAGAVEEGTLPLRPRPTPATASSSQGQTSTSAASALTPLTRTSSICVKSEFRSQSSMSTECPSNYLKKKK